MEFKTQSISKRKKIINGKVVIHDELNLNIDNDKINATSKRLGYKAKKYASDLDIFFKQFFKNNNSIFNVIQTHGNEIGKISKDEDNNEDEDKDEDNNEDEDENEDKDEDRGQKKQKKQKKQKYKKRKNKKETQKTIPDENKPKRRRSRRGPRVNGGQEEN